MPDYNKGQVYVIRNTVNDFVYVGSTTQTISQRWAEHMTNVRGKNKKHSKIYRAIEELGVDNFYIEFVEAWPCENKGQLCAREGHHIRQLDSVKNGYNDRVAGRTDKQRYQEDDKFREKYRKVRRERKKERYHSNEEFREKAKKTAREQRHIKKAERMQGPAQTESLELK
jgi:group I intron endonuclease